MDEAERFAAFRLWMTDGIGVERARALTAAFGSAAAAVAAPASARRQRAGIPEKVAAALDDPATLETARRDWERCGKLGVRWLHHDDADFPETLREIPRPPLALTLRGEWRPRDAWSVAVVGSRKCSPYGLQMAASLSRGLAARGVTIVSGLARGIDAAAHRAALEAGGRTVAVLASGLANVYPPEHAELAEDVVRSGALLSEAPLDGPPMGPLFPLRNRIVAGLSRGVLVVEAAEQSGALSTARHALEQGREVFAIPGRVGDPASAGTNRLLKQGAALVQSVEDVLEQLGPLDVAIPDFPAAATASAAAAEPPPALTPEQQAVWTALGLETMDLDSLAERAGLGSPQVAGALLRLELRRLVQRLPGNRYARR